MTPATLIEAFFNILGLPQKLCGSALPYAIIILLSENK